MNFNGFIGSGSTLAAGRIDGAGLLRHGTGSEIVDLVAQRWQGLAGKQAVLEGDGRTFEEIAGERRKAAA